MRDEELVLIGMKEAPPRPADDDPVARQSKVSMATVVVTRLRASFVSGRVLTDIG